MSNPSAASPRASGDGSDGSTLPGGVQQEAVRISLERILSSQTFSHSPRLSTFLSFVVEKALAGRSAELKEYLIGCEVLGRKSSYDPRGDPIVRVEAGRLREKLTKYYETEGLNDPIRIELPKGGYRPSFLAAPEIPASPNQPLTAVPPFSPLSFLRRPWTLGLTLTLLAALSAAATYWATRSATAESSIDRTRGSHVGTTSIGILPFADLSPESDQAYFSAGLTEELINALTRVQGLRVAPLSSTARLSGLKLNLRQIGEELDVTAVLEGSVRKAGDRLRISVRVSNVSEGYTMWAETYERSLQDVFAVQEEISQAIVRSLGGLSVRPSQPITPRYTANVEAFNLYLKGRYFWNQRGEEPIRRAISFFEQAIKEDAQYAAAYSGIADCYGALAHLESQAPDEAHRKAKAAAIKALGLNPELAEAHASLGLIQLYYDWNFSEAERSFRRAFEINPNYATAYHWYSVLLSLDGQLEKALVYMKRAEELEPLWPNVKRALGSLYFRKREYDKSIDKCREALDLDPDLESAHACLARSYEQKGLYQEAIAELQKVRESSTRQVDFTAMIARATALGGEHGEARRLVKDLEELSTRSYVPAYYVALVYSGLGDKEAALLWLEKAFDERSVQILGLSGDPRFDLLGKDARFQALVQKLPALGRRGLRPEPL